MSSTEAAAREEAIVGSDAAMQRASGFLVPTLAITLKREPLNHYRPVLVPPHMKLVGSLLGS